MVEMGGTHLAWIYTLLGGDWPEHGTYGVAKNHHKNQSISKSACLSSNDK